jgi:glycine/D-amino acid oxidase-like deaminating enzyme
MRAVVIGCGIVGASTALALARRGWSVTVVDRAPGPGLGSTARSSSVIRCHYTHEEAIKLALEGRRVWQRWGEWLGIRRPRARYVASGVLFLFGRASGARPALGLGVKAEVAPGYVRRMVALENRLGVGCALLRGRELAARFPYYAFDGEEGLYEPDSGYVAYPDEAVADLVQAARRRGVRFAFGARVTAIETSGEPRRVVAVVARRRHAADAVVNAAGPWSHEVNLLARCPLPLTTAPLHQPIVEAELEAPADVPMPATADLASGFYLRPDPRVFKIGAVLPRDHLDFATHADAAADPRALARFARERLASARRRIPGLTLRRIRVRPAMYDWTVADSYPVIDGTDVAGYFVAVGTSGAWFKSGPVIGELVAQRMEGRTRMRLPLSGGALDLRVFSRARAPIV